MTVDGDYIIAILMKTENGSFT